MTLRRRAVGGALLSLLSVPVGHAGAAPAQTLLLDERPGTPLFDAVLADLDHQAARLPRNGRPLIVNFWARWCGPCKVEIPELVALHARRSGADVVGIALENQGAAVRDFARAYDMDYPLLLARDGAGLELMRALGNEQAGLPFTVALDRRGTVVARRLGLITREQLDLAVQRALR